MSPTTTCTATVAWARRSGYQNPSDGILRSHAIAPHAAATPFVASTAMPRVAWKALRRLPFGGWRGPSGRNVRYTLALVLKSYVPALVFLALGIGVGVAFTTLNSLLGPKRPSRTKSDPYESGLPSEVKRSFRFGVSFYLVAMLFILFDIEVIFLYPIAVRLQEIGTFALVETIVFVVLLLVAFVYVWRRGALEWK